MGLTNKQEEFMQKLKSLVEEGRLMDANDALGLSLMLRTDAEIDSMETFLKQNPNAQHDDILGFAIQIKKYK